MPQAAATPLPTVIQCSGFLLFKTEGGKFLLVNPYVGAGNVLIDEDTNLLQTLNAMQYSQADNAAQVLRAATRLTTLQLQLAQAGIIPDAETQPDTAE